MLPQRRQRHGAGFRCDDGDEASLAGKIERIETEQLAHRADGVVDRYRGLRQLHREPRRACQFVCDRREAAARRVAHEAQAGDRRQRLRLRQDARGIRLQVAAQAEILPRQHDRGAMVADRPTDEDLVARPHVAQP